ncbi:MAG: hypothetical protein AAFR87_17540 [Bacteroidota bacterium]
MLSLTASPDSSLYKIILEKMEELSLAKEIINSDQDEIILTDGEEVFIGEAAILSHLDELARIVHQWYDCHC